MNRILSASKCHAIANHSDAPAKTFSSDGPLQCPFHYLLFLQKTTLILLPKILPVLAYNPLQLLQSPSCIPWD
jgi:hypothetical protein